MLNRYWPASRMRPEGGELHVDDVLVAGQHQALVRYRLRERPPVGVDQGPVADLGPVDLRHLGQENRLEGPGQMIVEARLGGLGPLAPAQHHALLVGLDAVEAGQQPDAEHDDEEQDEAAAPAHSGHKSAEAILPTPEHLFEIWRCRLRPAPAAARRAAPGPAPAAALPAALVRPGHAPASNPSAASDSRSCKTLSAFLLVPENRLNDALCRLHPVPAHSQQGRPDSRGASLCRATQMLDKRPAAADFDFHG